MGRGTFIAALAAFWLAGPALAAEAEAIPMTDGPYGSGRSLGSAWSMSCAPQQRLVGINLYRDGHAIAGVEALCAPLAHGAGGTVWTSDPVVAEMPALPPPRLTPIADEDVDAEARRNVLRVSSSGSGRRHGSRAVLITVPRDPEPAWTLEAPERISLRTGRHGEAIRCPDGAYVQGLRTGIEAGRRGKLVAVQLLCTRGNGRVEIVGDWPKDSKRKKNKWVAAVLASRTQCGGGSANPHDGAAGRALIGTAENGRVVSLGVSCARAAVSGPVSRLIVEARRWMASVVPPLRKGGRRVYQAPQWYVGADVAVCRDGSGRGYCAQDSADRFCSTMNGSGGAVFYVVGGFSEDAIAAGGKRCPSGACRAFQKIVCTG